MSLKKSNSEKPIKTPPCVIEEVNFCRGCPGWSFMIKAQREKIGLWGELPIFCPVTGAIKYPDISNDKK